MGCGTRIVPDITCLDDSAIIHREDSLVHVHMTAEVEVYSILLEEGFDSSLEISSWALSIVFVLVRAVHRSVSHSNDPRGLFMINAGKVLRY